MFKRILMPLDGSEIAEAALPWGEELARALGSEVVLYHVRGHENQPQEHMHQLYLDRLAESVRRNISKGRPKGSQVKVTTKIEAGEPAENICNLVDKTKVDLIVMTAVSAAGLKLGKMLGSVSDSVCRTVPIPVLLIRPQNAESGGKRRLLNRMLLPVDGSELSKLALPVGQELAAKLNLKATIFRMANMVRLYDDGTGSSAYIDYPKLNADEKKRVTAQMDVLQKTLKAKGLDATSVVTSGFDAADDIIDISKKKDIDLVVMSTHGQSGLGRWVFGSIAEKVLRHGETPLLLLHARAK